MSLTARYTRGLWTSASEVVRLLGLLLSPRSDARGIYTLLADQHLLSEQSLFLNLGYWADPAVRTFDQASQALAELLATTSGLGPEDTLLDAGFGFGDQDLYWYERFQPRSIIGVNITPLHVARARQRVEERGLSGRIDLRQGSATATGLADQSVDKVFALESAHHFDTREDFFREALRVLRPGGKLCTADVIPLPGHSFSYSVRTLWHTPQANHYPREEYARKLEAVGFRHVEVRSIRGQVILPYLRQLERRLQAPDLVARMNPIIRLASRWSSYSRDMERSCDYVLALAEK